MWQVLSGRIGRLLRALSLGGGVCSLLLATAALTAAPSGAQAASCGVVQVAGPGVVQNTGAAQQAEHCFWQAYQAGQPASLTLRVMGVDTLATHTLTLTPGTGGLLIQDTVQLTVVPRPPAGASNYTCAALRQEPAGLRVLGCGTEGDILIPAPAAPPSPAADFSDPAFLQTWERTDALVAAGQVTRSWSWGPVPLCSMREPYPEAPDGSGTHLVQYFDKSRMELNAGVIDPASPWVVTTGLLAYELIAGQVQLGPTRYQTRAPSEIPLASDFDDSAAPTYRSFKQVSSTPDDQHLAPPALGQLVTATIDRAGQVGHDPQQAAHTASRIAYYEQRTSHNVPAVFWAFINQVGLVEVGGAPRMAPLSPAPDYITGLPISEAYWAHVQIAGAPHDVLIQAYQRRVLTYIPDYAAPWDVQMGNVGIHYLLWRYGPLDCSAH